MKQIHWTGWRNIDAIEAVMCPKCKEEAGMICRTPKKRKHITPHIERIREFKKEHPDYNANIR